MRKAKIIGVCFLAFFVAAFMLAPAVQSEQEFKVTFEELEKHKALLDDPRPVFKNLSYKKIIPAEVYAKVTYDIEAMKKLWAEVIGFKSPDVVGKIAPEIKPGTYTYKDKEKYSGFKKLMIPDHYARFKPGAPPHVGNFPEIEVIPTRQYYWALPIAEATRRNMGRTQLDDQGYILPDTYTAGFPFPRPSGKFRAQQIMYNWEKRYFGGENQFFLMQQRGVTKNFKVDFAGASEMSILRLHGRTMLEPYGCYDERARIRGEHRDLMMHMLAPRDLYGNVMGTLTYLDRNKFDRFFMYISALRRIRKLSATDTQDRLGGQDYIYDDQENFAQKLNPERYPYKYDVIAEREYLVPAPQIDGAGYLSSKGMEFRNCRFERRSIWVVKLTQMDKTYVFSYRILYFDKETFQLYLVQNYDQKGRLYVSTGQIFMGFIPEMGLFVSMGGLARDHLDLHSTYVRHFVIPVATWLGRDDFNLRSLIAGSK